MTKNQSRNNKPEKTCAAKLKKIKKAITAEDRKQAMTVFNKSYITITRYLGGNVANLSLGLGLLQFFHKRIQQRLDELNNL